MNCSSAVMKRPGASSCGRWPTVYRRSLQATARYRRMSALGVSDRDDSIACAPDDERGHVLGEVRPVPRANALGRRSPQRPARWRGRPPGSSGRQATRSRERPRRLRPWDVARRSASRARPCCPTVLPSVAVAPPMNGFAARQRTSTRDRAYLGPQPAAGNGALGARWSRETGARTPLRDPTTERVSDERCTLVAKHDSANRAVRSASAPSEPSPAPGADLPCAGQTHMRPASWRCASS